MIFTNSRLKLNLRISRNGNRSFHTSFSILLHLVLGARLAIVWECVEIISRVCEQRVDINE